MKKCVVIARKSAITEEIIQMLVDKPKWNNLFNLDLLIRQYIVQEAIFDTLLLDGKIIGRLGVQ